MSFRASSVLPEASSWTVMRSAPAFTKSPMYLAGSSIIRWTSKGSSVQGLRHLMTGAPKVRLGTNIPSMTSRCTQSAPNLSMREISSPTFEKSHESIDGAILVMVTPYAHAR